jgi:hypothetical protein
MVTPIYKVEDGSIITFKVVGPQYNAVLTSPSGNVIESEKSLSANYNVLAENVILLYNNGIMLKYSEILPQGNSPSQQSPDQDPGEDFLSPNPVISTIYEYSIPRVVALDPVDPVDEASSKINNNFSVNNNKTIKDDLNSKLPTEVKLTNTLNENKENIKKTLIPFILSLLTKFGPLVVQSITKNVPLSRIVELASCPPSDVLLKLIKKRNNLVKQINNIYNVVKTLSKISLSLNTIIQAIKVGINIALLNPYPTPVSVADNISTLKKQLDKYSVTINIITITLSSFGLLLGVILQLLTLLDIMVEKCFSDNTNSNNDYEVVNAELMAFVNTSTGVSNSEVFNADKEYKDFKLELKLDDTNSSKYPKHYAQALNKQGVPVLKTESSFTSDNQTLINELKFIIDSNPNLTAE